jgi:hypothetical protein
MLFGVKAEERSSLLRDEGASLLKRLSILILVQPRTHRSRVEEASCVRKLYHALILIGKE